MAYQLDFRPIKKAERDPLSNYSKRLRCIMYSYPNQFTLFPLPVFSLMRKVTFEIYNDAWSKLKWRVCLYGGFRLLYFVFATYLVFKCSSKRFRCRLASKMYLITRIRYCYFILFWSIGSYLVSLSYEGARSFQELIFH